MTALEFAPSGRPVWLRVAAGIGIIWYAFGLLQFWLGLTIDTAAAVATGGMSAAHAAALAATPALIWLAFALASGAGLIGAALLFVGSHRAALAFALSLGSALVYYGWIYGISGTGADRPPEEAIIGAVVVAVTSAFLLLALRASRG